MDLQDIDNLKVKDALFDLFPEEKAKLLDEKAEALFPMLIPYFDEYYNNFSEQIDAANAAIEDVALGGNARVEDAFSKIAEANASVEKLGTLIEQVKAAYATADNELQKNFTTALAELTQKQTQAMLEEQKARTSALDKLQKGITTVDGRFTGLRDSYEKSTKVTNKTFEDIRKQLKKEISDVMSKMAGIGGGNMNRNISVGGNTSMLSRYGDINLKAGANVTLTYVNNNTTKSVDITIASSGGGGGSVIGTTRSINTISTSQSAGSASTTDYVYICSAGIRVTMPDPTASNTNLYTIKNTSASSVLISPFASETIDGSSSLILPLRYTSVDLISDGTNWDIT